MKVWHWLVRVVALASLALLAAVVVVDMLDGWPLGGWQIAAVSINTTVGIVYIGVGWLLAERHPRNPVGPLLLGVGVIYAVVGPFDLYLSKGRDQPWSEVSALVAMAAGIPIGVCLTTAMVLFPDGRPPSRRWWVIIGIGLVGAALGIAALTFGSRTFAPVYADVSSPFAVPGFPRRALLSLSDAAALGLRVAAITALVVRWRRGEAVERAQTTWVLAAVVISLVTELLARATSGSIDAIPWLLGWLQNVGLALIPIAMGIAILRYRLYAIDRIVSRTIGYAWVTAVLAGIFLVVYAVLTVVLAKALSGAPEVVTAIATLVAALSFTPVTHRIMSVVNRRFHRVHYDAERTVAGFAGRLRDQLDLPALTLDLRRTANEAVEPTTTGVWLRGSAS